MEKSVGKVNYKKVILELINEAGTMLENMVVPSFTNVRYRFTGNRIRGNKDYSPKFQVNSTVKKLIKQGLIEKVSNKSGIFLQLTSLGEREYHNTKLREEINHKKFDKWDGKWRIVIFDIKEEDVGLRRKIRNELIQFGFEKLQNSVWITPHDCEELIMLLKTDFRIGKDILFIVAEKVENEEELRKLFEL